MPKEKTPEEKFREMVKTGEGWAEFTDALKEINVPCIIQPLAQDQERQIILNTNTVLDDLFGGGLSAGQTVELYGEFASGKTQTLMTLTVEAADKGLVVYIDAEDTFSRKRTIQIAKERGKDVEKVSSNILLYKPDTWEEQLAVSSQLPDPLPAPLKLIIIDSLMGLFRSTPEFSGRQNLGKRQELMRWHLRQFKRLAKKEGCIIVYTNQVYDEPVSNPFLPKWAAQHPVGGHSVAHIGDYRIFLRKGPTNIRIARLVDNSELPSSERIFQINEKGIDDLPPEQMEEAKKRIDKYEKAATSGQLVKKRKKKKKAKGEDSNSEESEDEEEGEEEGAEETESSGESETPEVEEESPEA